MADKIGPTGEFPRGKIRPDDEGGLNTAISHDDKGNVFIDFGKKIKWLALSKDEAMQLAMLLMQHAGAKVTLLDDEKKQ